VDATLLAAEAGMNWDRVVDSAIGARLAPAVAVMLRWVAEALSAPVPTAVLDRLDQAAAAVDAFERDLALHAVRQGAIRKAWRGSDRRVPLRSRLRRWGWETFPTPRYLRWAHGERGRGSLAALYLRRPIEKVVAEARWAVHRARHRARS
jgi:hypothetical protein